MTISSAHHTKTVKALESWMTRANTFEHHLVELVKEWKEWERSGSLRVGMHNISLKIMEADASLKASGVKTDD